MFQLEALSKLPAGRAFVPGCGRGYDVAFLAGPDRHVTGLEYTHKSAEVARAYVRDAAPSKSGFWTIDQGDFFHYKAEVPFDLVYDHTFLCALPPVDRSAWAERMSELVCAGGMLVTQMWPLHPDSSVLDLTVGPPFSLSKAVYSGLLLPVGFVLESLDDIAECDMIPGRKGVEAIGVWRRLPGSRT